MLKSEGLKNQTALEVIKNQPENAVKAEVKAFMIKRANNARDNRNQTREEFDGLSYEEDYILNKRAGNSFLRTKINDSEVRVNSGTTEKKIETVYNELLSLNLKPEIRAFDQFDREATDFGQQMTDIVVRTNEIERDDDVWMEAVHELLTQRALFLQEVYVDKEVRDKQGKRRMAEKSRAIHFIKNRESITNIKATTHRIQRAEKRVLDGRQVFLGDIRIPAHRLNDQPYIILYEKMTYWEAKTLYGHLPNWKYVKPGNANDSWYGGSFAFRMMKVENEEVEILHYMSYPDDEKQDIINGVMMDEVGTKLPWESEGYNMSMTVIKPMGRDFAYGKPLTASAKFLQGLNDEMIRLVVRKAQQALAPPSGNSTGTVLSKDIWNPASMVNGLKKDDIFSLIDHRGMDAGDINILNYLEGLTSEFVGASKLVQGTEEKKLTATQTVQQLQQSIKQLGLSVLALMRAKRDMTYLRIDTVFENYMFPVEKQKNKFTNKIEDVYRQFTLLNTPLSSGNVGTKIIKFTDRGLEKNEREELRDFEDRQTELGKPFEIKTVNIKSLRDFNIMWHVVVNQKEKQGTALDKIMFQDELNQANAISQLTQTPLNAGRLIESFESKWQSKGLFQTDAPKPEGNVEGEAKKLLGDIEGLGGGNDLLKKGQEASINTLASQPV